MTKSIERFDTHLEVSNFGRDLNIWFFRRRHGQGSEHVEYVKPLPIAIESSLDELHQSEDSSLSIDRATAQNLLDGLWNAGFRPRNGEGMNAQVDAIKEHLSDMRKLVFDGKRNG